MGRRGASTANVPGQIDLFGGTVEEAAATSTPARAVVKSGFGGKADAVLEVLDQIHNGRFGRLMGTDRVVRLDGEGRCRHALEADASVVEHLVAQRYAKVTDIESVRHGALTKSVELLTLTPGGLGLLSRSSRLRAGKPR